MELLAHNSPLVYSYLGSISRPTLQWQLVGLAAILDSFSIIPQMII